MWASIPTMITCLRPGSRSRLCSNPAAVQQEKQVFSVGATSVGKLLGNGRDDGTQALGVVLRGDDGDAQGAGGADQAVDVGQGPLQVLRGHGGGQALLGIDDQQLREAAQGKGQLGLMDGHRVSSLSLLGCRRKVGGTAGFLQALPSWSAGVPRRRADAGSGTTPGLTGLGFAPGCARILECADLTEPLHRSPHAGPRPPFGSRSRPQRGQGDHLLHVRLPLRHPGASARRRDPLHRGQPRPPAQPGGDLRQGVLGDHEAVLPGAPDQAPAAGTGAERGTSQFEEISWGQAFDLLAERLRKIRAEDPKRFALFTGRDQMQALTGLFAKQFGTPNYAAHGGFCSVNMAAGLIYTIGGSFWEFGGPDLDRAKLFVMIGTAEDHHSNPLKIAISKFKRRGGRFVSINPIRTGYSAIADEWVPIKPGTDGALLLAIIHQILKQGLYDRDFLVQYTNAAELVVDDPDRADHGLFRRFEIHAEEGCFDPENKLWWDPEIGAVGTHTPGAEPRLLGSFTLDDGTRVKPGFQLLKERVDAYTPEWAAGITGIPAETIRRLAHEMGVTARDQKIELPIPWTDCWDNEHASVTGNPVAFHAMRGMAAHSNGFQTIRALGILMTILGTIDRPGGFRHKAPFPRPIPPCPKPPNGPQCVQPDTPLDGMPLGWPAKPEDLFVDDLGEPVRIDKAFSWEYPLAVHGLMHNVITNAWRGDPYRIDTLLLFMANMAWNSSMNTVEVRKMLADKDENGEYKIPFLVVCDTFASETVAFADLVLPDTTYLERHDVLSMLDRPISEFDGPVDSVRIPVLPPEGECKPFQEVLIELGSRLGLPAFVKEDGVAEYRDYPDFIINHETSPGSGIGYPGRLAGQGRREVPQGRAQPAAMGDVCQEGCFYHHELPCSTSTCATGIRVTCTGPMPTA